MNAMIHKTTTAEYRMQAGTCEAKYAKTGDIRFLESAGHLLLAAVCVYPFDPRVSELARKDIRNLRARAASFLRSVRNAQSA